MVTLAEILHSIPGLEQTNRIDTAGISVTQVVGDSRRITSGSLFVAIEGGRADGHRFLSDAQQRGAVAAIGLKTPDELHASDLLPENLPYFQVEDGRRALAFACAALHQNPSHGLIAIGITGTDGKTSTSSILEAILAQATHSEAFPRGRVGLITTVGASVCGVTRDTGLHVTTPDAPEIQQFLADIRDTGCTHAIVEATSHGLDQSRVDAVEFDVAAITNITHEHLDYHGNWDAYAEAKAKLFRFLFAAGPKQNIPRVAVLNAGDPASFPALCGALEDEMARSRTPVTIYAYGLSECPSLLSLSSLDIQPVTAEDIDYAPDATHFSVKWRGGSFGVKTRLLGEFNVQNALCATTAALAIGVPPDAIQAGLARFAGVSGRMERIDEGQSFLAVVDFAHSPASLERALMTLRQLMFADGATRPGRLIAVFGSAGLRDVGKRRLMGEVGGRLADITIVTAEDPRTEDLDAINAEIVDGVLIHAARDAVLVVPDRAEAIGKAVEMAEDGDIVAAFGKGHERSMCFGETEYPWNEQEVMRLALRSRRTG